MESPIAKLRKELNMTAFQMAAECTLTNTRYRLIEDGAMSTPPIIITKLAEAHRGPGEGIKFTTEFREWRNSLPPETVKQLEKELWPAGQACGMCP